MKLFVYITKYLNLVSGVISLALKGDDDISLVKNSTVERLHFITVD